MVATTPVPLGYILHKGSYTRTNLLVVSYNTPKNPVIGRKIREKGGLINDMIDTVSIS